MLAGSEPFTIESFYRHIGEGRLTAARCLRCDSTLLPPRPLCPRCLSADMEWIQLGGRGRVETFTVIHVAPEEFRDQVPYTVAIVKLEEGARITGQVKGVPPEEVEIGMEVEIKFEPPRAGAWPRWARYHFEPVEQSPEVS